jgi:hypothetical protein
MNWPLLETYAKSVWAVAGPLIGVLIGAYIANRNQRKHWIADNKREEYRELLAALHKVMFLYTSADVAGTTNIAKWVTERPEIILSAVEVFESRLFTNTFASKLDVGERLGKAFTAVVNDNNISHIGDEVAALLKEIRTVVYLDIGI